MDFSSEDGSDDEEDIEKEIQKFNSLFYLKRELEEQNMYNRDKIHFKLETFIEELNCGYENEEEFIRSENCVSFLYWLLGKTKEAFEYCDKVLQRDSENLIALTNKTYFLLKTNEIRKSKTVLDTLKKLKSTESFGRLNTNATAEIAYLYARFGPKFQVKAIEFFREALMQCPSRDLWKFGLSLTIKRQAHLLNTAEPTKENMNSKAVEAANLFFEVCTNDRGESSIRAKAYCELGNLLNSFPFFSNGDTKMQYFKWEIEPRKCFEEALRLRPDDVFVLEKCGKQFRYFSNQPQYKYAKSCWLLKSKELLEKSLNIRKTAFAYHHLGLTLEAIAKDEMNNVKFKKRNLEVSFGRHGQARGFPRSKSDPPPKTSSSTKPNALKVRVKSPKKLQTSPGNKLFLEAIEHIKKAIELQKGLFALGFYDIGLLYRKLEENDNAIRSFNVITREGKVRQHAAPITIINAYEQQGIIKLENAERETDTKKKEELIYDGKKLLRQAVKLSAKNIMRFSSLRCAWEAFPTLTNLLQSEDKNTKDLARLHELVGLYHEAIDFYKEVYQSKDSSEKAKKQALKRIVENYVKENDFDNAEVFLDCLRCTGEAHEIPKELYFTTYLQGAMHAASKDDRENMKSRFNSAYKICLPNTRESNVMDDETDECDRHDVMLLKTCEDDDDSNLREILTDMCGLRVTVDTENCPYGSNELKYIAAMVNQCYCIFCILKSSMNDKIRERFMDLAVANSPGKVFVIKDMDYKVPDQFGGAPALQYPASTELDQATGWIELFLQKLNC